jgi:hypothetical protein
MKKQLKEIKAPLPTKQSEATKAVSKKRKLDDGKEQQAVIDWTAIPDVPANTVRKIEE